MWLYPQKGFLPLDPLPFRYARMLSAALLSLMTFIMGLFHVGSHTYVSKVGIWKREGKWSVGCIRSEQELEEARRVSLGSPVVHG